MVFNFPRIKFVDTNGVVMQANKLVSEANEVLESVFTPDIMHTAEEFMDSYAAAETGLRIVQEKHGINLSELRRNVERKNALRGYYDEETTNEHE